MPASTREQRICWPGRSNSNLTMVWRVFTWERPTEYGANPRRLFALFNRAIDLTTGAAWAEGSRAVAYVMIGERGQAELILQRLLGRRDHQYTSALCLAVVFSALGEIEEALEWLDSAIEERDSLLPLINILRLFDELEDKPRYRALLDRLRLA